MEHRDQMLQKKADRIRKGLVKWAKLNNILRPGEQLEVTLNIKEVPVVVSKITGSILDMTIPEFFTIERCSSLNISERRRHIIINRLWRKDRQVNIGPYNEPEWHEMRTIRDLVRFSKNQIMGIRNLGQLTFDQIEKTLCSVGINLPEYSEL